jgi:aryl-alcohol dehydrogenase-like predicted oxidoreductase
VAPVRFKLFGRSGLRVSELCLGTMTFGSEWGWGAARDESRRMFEAFLDRGGNFIDTANNYTNGTSERFVGEFAAPCRRHLVIATKYTLSTNPDDPNAGGNHRKNMIQSVEASLRRLGTDYVDILWVHAWDAITPVEEVVRALDDLVRSGKVLYVGVSDTPAWVVAQAVTMAELRGWSRFVGLQIEYSLVERTPERDLLPMARALDLAVTPWSPLAAGLLTGKYNGPAPPEPARGDFVARRFNERNLAIANTVATVARETGRTPSQIALAWLRSRPGVQIPILGARSVAQLDDNLGCLDVELDGGALERLDEVSRIDPGFPHAFLEIPFIRQLVHGNHADRVDNHRAR